MHCENKKGLLVVLSAPSGCGKDTVFRAIEASSCPDTRASAKVSPSTYSMMMAAPSPSTSSMPIVRHILGWSIRSPISNSFERA